MKASILLIAVFCSSLVFAQTEPNKHQSSFELGEGLNFSFQDGDYKFKLGGMMQPQVSMQQLEGEDPDFFLNSKRTYLNFGGVARNEKISFFMQLDFSRNDPLLDVWLGYHPIKQVSIYAGQKQNITNNREMLIMENYLQFPDRSILSTTFSRTGRELGLFLETRWGNESFLIKPQASVTSGDGRNSFGADSRDVDYGGVKYGGRLDILPFGEFTGTFNGIADLEHEENIKMLLGAAAFYNDGASEAVGEGHGEFLLYDVNGNEQLPDYRQYYFDLHAKYKGFSILGEYVIASATSLENLYTEVTGTEPLYATEISEYLSLGSGYNAQLGYVTKSGYGLDIRYGAVTSEFENNRNALIRGSNEWKVGFTKYVKKQSLKLHLNYGQMSFDEDLPNLSQAEFLLQLMF